MINAFANKNAKYNELKMSTTNKKVGLLLTLFFVVIVTSMDFNVGIKSINKNIVNNILRFL